LNGIAFLGNELTFRCKQKAVFPAALPALVHNRQRGFKICCQIIPSVWQNLPRRAAASSSPSGWRGIFRTAENTCS